MKYLNIIKWDFIALLTDAAGDFKVSATFDTPFLIFPRQGGRNLL
jgi:hypothetical protein